MSKKQTLRQRLRADAAKQLDEILEAARAAISKSLPDSVSYVDAVRCLAGKRTESIRNRMITVLADETEAELERLYNNQQSLPIEEPDKGNSSEGD